MGPFEEGEEETGVTSDVVKVEGEDPATPGPLQRNDSGTVTIPQYRFDETKQHTPLVCVSEAIELLALWRHIKPKPKTKNQKLHASCVDSKKKNRWPKNKKCQNERTNGWVLETQGKKKASL